MTGEFISNRLIGFSNWEPCNLELMELRDLGVGDREGIFNHYSRLSDQDRRFRFLGTINIVALNEYVNNIDFKPDQLFGHFSFMDDGSLKLVSLAHLTFDMKKKVLDVALSVNEVFQSLALDEVLINKAIDVAKISKYSKLTLSWLQEDNRMHQLAKKIGFKITFDNEARNYEGVLII